MPTVYGHLVLIQFNLLVSKCGYHRKTLRQSCHRGVRLIRSLNDVRIHFSRARAQSRFEDVDRWRSNNESGLSSTKPAN